MHADRAAYRLQLFIMAHRREIQDSGSNRPLTFHGLRHSFAAEKYQALVDGGMSKLDAHFEVSHLLGHERADVTDIYLASLEKGAQDGQ